MSYAQKYRQFLEPYLGRPFGEGDGDARPAPIPIPLALREFYDLAGAVPALCTAFNRVRPPDSLRVEAGMLVYMEENQEVALWGIREEDLAAEDPLVYQDCTFDPPDWISEELTVSDWLIVMSYWQLVNCHGEASAYAIHAPEAEARVRSRYGELRSHPNGPLKFFGDGSCLVGLLTGGPQRGVWAMSQDPEALRALVEGLDITWDNVEGLESDDE